MSDAARAHRGHCVSPVDDGPLLVAFASAQDGLDAARDLAGHPRRAGGSGHRGGGAPGRALRRRACRSRRPAPDDGRPGTGSSSTTRPPGRSPAGFRPRSASPSSATRHPAGPPAWALVAPGLSGPPRAYTCPYRGLMAFRAEDGDLFFGREEVVASILDRILHGGFIAVVGPSGSGKSSLVRAGLVLAYRRAREGSVVVMTPGLDPAAELERSLSAGPPSLLIVDQFEEVFTLCPDEASRAGSSTRCWTCASGLRVDRGRAPGGLLRAMRRPFPPRPDAGRAPPSARADAARRASSGHRGSCARGGTSTRGRPGRRDAGRRRRRARRAPAALPRALRVMGPPEWPGAHPGGLPSGGRRARGDRPHGGGGLRRLQRRRSKCSCGRCSSGSPSWARRRRTPAGRVPIAELIPEGEGGREATAVLEQLAGCSSSGRGRRLGRDRARGADP